MHLVLTTEERELLAVILEERHRQLQREISHADHISFRRVLRQRENTLEAMLEKVGLPASA